jgi:hypothetical protein
LSLPPGGQKTGTVAAFAARLNDTVDLESVREDHAAVLDRALEPAHVPVWINQEG